MVGKKKDKLVKVESVFGMSQRLDVYFDRIEDRMEWCLKELSSMRKRKKQASLMELTSNKYFSIIDQVFVSYLHKYDRLGYDSKSFEDRYDIVMSEDNLYDNVREMRESAEIEEVKGNLEPDKMKLHDRRKLPPLPIAYFERADRVAYF